MSISIVSLASGSKGNCTLVFSDSTAILVDAGIAYSRINSELRRFGLTTAKLDGVVVTHEHADHIAALPKLGRDTKVYAHPKTADAILKRQGELNGYTEVDFYEGGFTVGDIEVIPFRIPHDAVYPLGYSFRLVDNMVVIRPSEQVPEERKITGVVKDKEGNPLPGVAVVVKGTTVGTATDVDGNYTLHLPEGNYTLVFSMLGMKVKEELVGDRTEVNVVMEEDTQEMDEVVVTGIFKKARESYTGAVTTITDEELEMHRGQNLLQTLKNIDVSLNFRVDNLAGSDPNALPSISIRGSSSLPMSVQEFNQTASNAVNQPLIIMDGFEISLEKLMDYNDEEIESINILKDAAATAIYGSRGANGVIVVITKKPEAGKLKINAEVGLDMEIPDLMSYDLLTAREKLELEKEVGLYDIDIINNDMLYQELYNERLHRVLSGATTDWISKPIRTGVSSHYNLRLDGGSDQFRWGVSLGYRDVAGAMKGSYRRSFNGSITLMYTIDNLIFKSMPSYSCKFMPTIVQSFQLTSSSGTTSQSDVLNPDVNRASAHPYSPSGVSSASLMLRLKNGCSSGL